MSIYKKALIYSSIPWILLFIRENATFNQDSVKLWDQLLANIDFPGFLIIYFLNAFNVHAVEDWIVVVANVLFYYYVIVGILFVFQKTQRIRSLLCASQEDLHRFQPAI